MPVLKNSVVLLTAVLCAALGACSGPQAPLCRIGVPVAGDAQGNAGCLIAMNGRLLVVRNRVSGKLGFPAGQGEIGEIAQCTAHRETWEEAGLNVEVRELLLAFPATDFYLFACSLPEDARAGADADISPPPWAVAEVSEILWVDPEELDAAQWRFPEQWPYVLKAFRSHSGSVAGPRGGDGL